MSTKHVVAFAFATFTASTIFAGASFAQDFQPRSTIDMRGDGGSVKTTVRGPNVSLDGKFRGDDIHARMRLHGEGVRQHHFQRGHSAVDVSVAGVGCEVFTNAGPGASGRPEAVTCQPGEPEVWIAPLD